MNRFHVIKTIQLIIFIALTVALLLVVFLNEDIYAMIASNGKVRFLAISLWVILGLSFVFLYYDFRSYSGLKRENAELDHAIYSDALTGIANRYSVDVYIGQFLNQPLPQDMGCVTIDIANLSEINQKKGHTGGDAAIQDFSELLTKSANGVCFIGRNGGNKFLAIFRECSEKRLDTFLDALRGNVEAYNQMHSDVPISYTTGKAFNEGEAVHTLTELVALSDRRAWKAIGEQSEK